MWPHGCSGRRRARPPARLGGLTSFGAAPRSPPVPSGPSDALHTSGAGSLCVAERVGSKPGLAPPPPTNTAAWPHQSLRCPPHLWGRVADVWLGALFRLPATPRHRPRAPQPGPTNPSGALHTSDAYCAHVLSWPHRHPPAPRPALAALIAEPTPNFARNSPTTASSFEFRPLELQRFQTSLKLHSIELRATFVEGRP